VQEQRPPAVGEPPRAGRLKDGGKMHAGCMRSQGEGFLRSTHLELSLLESGKCMQDACGPRVKDS
jgi:hypothetical protein